MSGMALWKRAALFTLFFVLVDLVTAILPGFEVDGLPVWLAVFLGFVVGARDEREELTGDRGRWFV